MTGQSGPGCDGALRPLNCRIGDLAIVVSAELTENLGQIVEVVGLPQSGPLDMTGHGHLWHVRTVSGRETLVYRFNYEGGRTEKYAEGPVPDACLRPVSGLTDADSLHADLGKKLTSPRRKRTTVAKVTEEAPS